MVSQKSRWDDAGTQPPANAAKYVAGQQPIAEYDNWFAKAAADDIEALINIHNTARGYHEGGIVKHSGGNVTWTSKFGVILQNGKKKLVDTAYSPLAAAAGDVLYVTVADYTTDETALQLKKVALASIGTLTKIDIVLGFVTAAGVLSMLEGINTVEGVADHAALTNLDYASSGHTGFEASVNKGAANGYCELDAAVLVPLARIPGLPISKISNLQTELDERAFLNVQLEQAIKIMILEARDNAPTSDYDTIVVDTISDATGFKNTIDTGNTNAFYSVQYAAYTVAEDEYASDANTELLLHLNNNVTDSSSYGRTVTNTSVTFSSAVVKLGSHSARFNGSAKLEVTGAVVQGNAAGTLEAYVYFDNLNPAEQTIFEYSSGGQQDVKINAKSDGGIRVRYNNAEQGSAPAGSLAAGQWLHFVFRWDGSGVEVLVNQVSKWSSATTVSYVAGGTFRIGRGYADEYPMTGYVDEVRISDVRRTSFSGSYPTGVTKTVQTALLDTAPATITDAMLDYEGEVPTNTTLTLKVSRDNGATWTTVTKGVKTALTSTAGTQLKAKFELLTNDSTKTPKLKGYSVIYWS